MSSKKFALSINLEEVLLPSRDVRRALGNVSDMTLHRWMKKGILGEPIRINGRRYWTHAAIKKVQQGAAA